MTSLARFRLFGCAGLVIAPLVWAINTQAGQILPYPDCRSHSRLSAMLSLLLVLIALMSGWISWRARESKMAVSQRPVRFVAELGCLSALVFAFALLLQAAAGLMLTGCEQ